MTKVITIFNLIIYLKKLWERNASVPNHDYYYYFSKFTMNLNYLNDKMLKMIAPTDTRLRPD